MSNILQCMEQLKYMITYKDVGKTHKILFQYEIKSFPCNNNNNIH